MRQTTETTESTHLGREAGELHDGDRLAVDRQAEQFAEDLHHHVFDEQVVEHEGVARIVAERFDARDQPVILGPGRAVLELAHAVVDLGRPGRRCGRAPACRRCSRRARSCGSWTRSPRALAAYCALASGISSERISISSSTPGRPRKKTSTISSKLNSQNGSWRFFGLTTWAMSPKQPAVFVVRVDQEDAEVRLLRQDLLQDQRDAGRLADAGRAEHGEVLAQQLLEIDVGGNRRDRAADGRPRWSRRP